jgi:OFA family oxalate/formate antiporter-like MFS transporter
MTTPVETLSVDAARAHLKVRRWIQLVIGVICMVAIANAQYGWTFFATPIQDKYQWSLKAIQGSFTVFVAFETWLVPAEGYLVDRFGPRVIVMLGGAIAGLGWIGNSMADSVLLLYVTQAITGIGAGAVYGTCVGNALKWFPERRGLAAGLTAAGFGAGSALTVSPIVSMIKSGGYEAAFVYFGILQGAVVLVLGWFLRQPDSKMVAVLPKPAAMVANRPHFSWREMIRTRVFWVMYIIFVLMATGGLFITANLAQLAKSFGVGNVSVSLLFWTMPAAVYAAKTDRVMNGLTRPFFGWVSDKIGRENTMFIAFGLEGIGILLLNKFGSDPVAFVVLSGLVFFAWGEIYSLFPAMCTDTYGWKFATGNAGLLYTAKGTGALLMLLIIPQVDSGSARIAFLILASMNIVAALLAMFVLKPIRRDFLVKTVQAPATEGGPGASPTASPAATKGMPQGSQPLQTAKGPLGSQPLARATAPDEQAAEATPDPAPQDGTKPTQPRA